jgi:hypothetical protein
LRAIIALCGLTRQHPASALEGVCARACAEGLWRYKDLRRLLESSAAAVQPPLAFAEEHPLIRNLHSYAQFIAAQASAPTTGDPDFTTHPDPMNPTQP